MHRCQKCKLKSGWRIDSKFAFSVITVILREAKQMLETEVYESEVKYKSYFGMILFNNGMEED